MGIETLSGLAALVSALFLFAGSAYSMFIRMRIPVGKFSVIFPYLTMGTFMLGFMMVTYAIIFLLHLVEVVTYVTTIMFFLGTLIMMVGAYKVTLSFGGGPGPIQKAIDKGKAGIKKGKEKMARRKGEKKKKKEEKEKKKEEPADSEE
jgi:hypothetical protein